MSKKILKYTSIVLGVFVLLIIYLSTVELRQKNLIIKSKILLNKKMINLILV